MENKAQINIPSQIQEYLWTRYLPETTFKMYLMIGYLQKENVRGNRATAMLMNAQLEEENSNPAIIEEKTKVLKSLGFEYPKTRKDDLELLFKFKLVGVAKDPQGEMVYLYNIPLPRPEEVFSLDEQEKQNLEDIKFEMKHQNAFNMILTLLLNSNGNISATAGHIESTTNVKIAEIREVLAFLVREGSIKVTSQKSIDSLKKADKLTISINKEVFEKKRFILG